MLILLFLGTNALSYSLVRKRKADGEDVSTSRTCLLRSPIKMSDQALRVPRKNGEIIV